MTKKCLSAYTPPGGDYPPYINITQKPEGVQFTVRTRAGVCMAGLPFEGSIGHITVAPEIARKLLQDALDAIA